jgi:hypothetical protein
MGHEEPEPTVLYVDVDGLAADCGTIDGLARLALIARRHGCDLAIHHASAELADLIELAGLGDVLLKPR